ncbi:MAG: cytochrome-c peroxidase [Candidatus Polarisedimenticolia bacterium]
MNVRSRRLSSGFSVGAGAVLALLGTAACGGDRTATAPAAPQGESFTSGDYTTVLPLGLQAASAYVPESNPMSPAKVELGRKLYFDPRLSASKDISCATCHDPDKGFSDARPVSLGIGAQAGGRNAPTVINRLFSAEQFWDGRAADLEAQALGPIQNPIEMGHTLPAMIQDLQALQGYATEFQTAFGSPGINADRVAMAIAAYERTVVAGNAPFDRHQAGEAGAMSESAVRGMALFNDAQRANCVTCHAGFNFTDESYHNLGVGMDREFADLGRFTVTKVETDRGAFKTPTLRNLTQTGPYMHDGSETSLQAVIDFYDKGGVRNPWLSAEIRPLNLSPQEKADLAAFLEALTGEVRGKERPGSLPQ